MEIWWKFAWVFTKNGIWCFEKTYPPYYGGYVPQLCIRPQCFWWSWMSFRTDQLNGFDGVIYIYIYNIYIYNIYIYCIYIYINIYTVYIYRYHIFISYIYKTHIIIIVILIMIMIVIIVIIFIICTNKGKGHWKPLIYDWFYQPKSAWQWSHRGHPPRSENSASAGATARLSPTFHGTGFVACGSFQHSQNDDFCLKPEFGNKEATN